MLPETELCEYEINVIDYFKKVALGFEFGTASSITRKWNSELKIYMGGEPNTVLSDELERIKSEINALVTDGFQLKIVNDSLQSKYFIFFGIRGSICPVIP